MKFLLLCLVAVSISVAGGASVIASTSTFAVSWGLAAFAFGAACTMSLVGRRHEFAKPAAKPTPIVSTERIIDLINARMYEGTNVISLDDYRARSDRKDASNAR